MRSRIWHVAVSLLLVAGLTAGTQAHAAEPESGTIAQPDGPTEVRWTGGPFPLERSFCLTPADPTCDYFDLTVDAPDGVRVEVAVVAPGEWDDVDLQVYAPDGSRVAGSATIDGDNVVFRHSSGYGEGPYQVRVNPFNMSSDGTDEGLAHFVPTLADPPSDCSELVPHRAGIQGITDDGREVSLDVYVLIDERPFPPTSADLVAHAAEQFEIAKRAYEPLGIDLNVVAIEEVDLDRPEDGFQGERVTTELFDRSREHFGGARPDGSDVVYLMTNKNLQGSDGSSSVAGQADCIGGVEGPTTAFSVGEILNPGSLFDFTTQANGTGLVAAHEIGHLMGAHHHYGNCSQGEIERIVSHNEVYACTLMAPTVELVSYRFSAVNDAVVRDHAVVYASP